MLTQRITIDGFQLTPCEVEIIKQAMQQFSRKEMAANLGKTEDNLDSQMRHLYKKLGVKKISGLIIWAAKNGFDEHGNFTPVKPKGIDATEILIMGNIQKGIGKKKLPSINYKVRTNSNNKKPKATKK